MLNPLSSTCCPSIFTILQHKPCYIASSANTSVCNLIGKKHAYCRVSIPGCYFIVLLAAGQAAPDDSDSENENDSESSPTQSRRNLEQDSMSSAGGMAIPDAEPPAKEREKEPKREPKEKEPNFGEAVPASVNSNECRLSLLSQPCLWIRRSSTPD